MSQLIQFQINQLVSLQDREAHRLCGVSEYADPVQAMRRLVRAGLVPYVKVGGRYRVSLEALRAWAAAQMAAPLTSKNEGAGPIQTSEA